MKKTIFRPMSLALSVILLFSASCKKDNETDKDESNGSNCYNCQNCEGEYGHIISREYCVEGFDSRQDWLKMKTEYESAPNNCDCEFK
jgi:hypothetical protein